MPFKLDKQLAKVINVNLRKEAAGEEVGATLAIDIKLELMDVPAAALKAICPVDPGASLSFADALFSDSGTPRFFSLSGITFDTQIENAEVAVAHQKFQNCTIKNLELTKFSDGAKMDLRLTVQCHPSEAQVGALAEQIKEEVRVSIVPAPDLFTEMAA